MHAPESVSQEDKPCVLHTDHSPITVVNELHHVFPMEFQNDVWGEVRDNTRISVCSTGHNNIHAAIRYWDKNHRWPDWCRGMTRLYASLAVTRRDSAANDH